MNHQLATVTTTGGAERPRPRISFFGDWLTEIGFAPGALIQVLPEPEGMDFNLCNDNISSYSDLLQSTRVLNGNLIRVYRAEGQSRQGPTFVTSGRYIYKGGLIDGDTLVAQYQYGIIKVRKVDPAKLGFQNVKVVTTSYIARPYADDKIPKIRLSGEWLNEIGFGIGAVATAGAEPGTMTLNLQDADTEYNALMKYVRAQKLKIFQVYKEPHNRHGPQPCIGITGSIVDKAGFQPGDMLAASYQQGVIKLQKLDFEKLGF